MTIATEEASTNPGPRPFFHPAGRPYRFTVLLVVGFLTYGSYFAYDSVSPILPTLEKAWNTTEAGLGWLNGIYSIAAIASVFLGGILTDRIGTRRASLLFSTLIVLGAAVVSSAGTLTTALFGRFIFGAGSECLMVAQNAILTRWFRGRELALAFGLSLTIARLGTLFVFNSMALMDKRFGWQVALWIATALCVASLVANVVYCLLDRHGEKVLDLSEGDAGDKIVFSDIKRFGASYWYVVLLCVTFYSAIFPFTSFSTNFFSEKWGMPKTFDTGEASFLAAALKDFMYMASTAAGTSSIIIFASMCFAPFAGGLVDRIGRRATLMVVGSALMIPCHLVMGFTNLPPFVPMLVLGASFVLVPAAMWPAVALIVEKNRVGTAYGLMAMVQNLGLAVFNPLNGALRQWTGSYTASQGMFAALGVFGLMFALLLLAADRREGGVLERGRGLETEQAGE